MLERPDLSLNDKTRPASSLAPYGLLYATVSFHQESQAIMCNPAVPSALGALLCPGIAVTVSALRFRRSSQLARAELLINVSISYHPQHPISLSFSPAG